MALVVAAMVARGPWKSLMRLMARLRRAAETKGSVGGAQLVAVLARDDVSDPVEAVVRVGRGRGAVVSGGRLPRPLVRTRRAGFPAPGSA